MTMITPQKKYKMEFLQGKDEFTIEEIAQAIREDEEDYEDIPDEAKPEVERVLRESGDWEKLDRNNPSIRKYDYGGKLRTAKYIVGAIRYAGHEWSDVPDEAKPEVKKTLKEYHLWEHVKDDIEIQGD